MDRIVRVHHGGTVTYNDNGAELVGMALSMLVYAARPSFDELVASVKGMLGWMEDRVVFDWRGDALSVLVYTARPSFDELVASVKGKLGWTKDGGVSVQLEGRYDVGVGPRLLMMLPSTSKL